MKIKISANSERGTVLVMSLLVGSVLGISLASYFALVYAQNLSTVRSLAWNTALPVAEAGIEEALAHINTAASAEYWESNGWTKSDNTYTKTRTLGKYSWTATITATDPPTITATASIPTIVNGYFLASTSSDSSSTTAYTTRTIQVSVTKNALFTKAMVAKGQIDLKGNNVKTDSFDSSTSVYSTSGSYDSTKAKDNGDVATNSGVVNSLNVGNANIWGHVATGPGGSVSVGSNGAVGSKAWNVAGNTGIESGYSSDDMNVWLPDFSAPFTSGYTPASGKVDGVTYTYLLTEGNYKMSSLSLSGTKVMYVKGACALYVTDSISLTGNSKIVIAPGASLIIYMGGASASIGGNGIVNMPGNAGKFAYIGLPTNTSLSFGGNAAFTGVIYAPNADFTLGGGGSTTYDFVGASVSNTVTMNGHFNFHYDENLKNSDWSRGYIISSWNEL